MHVLGIEYVDWLNLLGVFSTLLREYQSKLSDEISKITFDKFTFDGKEFNDNLVALDRNGNILWSSKEIIDVPNRLGACFVGLHNSSNEDCIVNAQAYVGINYAIEVYGGKVIKKKITK